MKVSAALRETAIWRAARAIRHEWPHYAGRVFPGPDARALHGLCEGMQRRGGSTTIGYFDDGSIPAEAIVAAYAEMMEQLGAVTPGAVMSGGVALAIKAPPLGFDAAHFRKLATLAQGKGMSLIFDAHGPADADATLAAVEDLLPAFPATGCALPARWARSFSDVARLRDSSARIRVVKGEWPDTDGHGPANMDADYLKLVAALAGRKAPVGIATHKPALAEQALALLNAAGTPCELEQLRGLPRRRTVAVARRLGVPVRLYIPFGPGWTPYAIGAALGRPHIISWMLRDVLNRPDA